MADGTQAKVAGRPREECGVFGVSGSAEASRLAYLGLFALQHRGQETAGIVSAWRDAGHPHHMVHRGLGLVADVFDGPTLESLRGDVAIGHVRYSTTGAPNPANTQPVVSSLRFGPVAISHNGNLTNAHLLRERLKQEGAIFQTSIDTEVILHLISRAPAADFEAALRHALVQIDGAFSLAILHGDTMYMVRDANGFRPLALGRLGSGGWVAASETSAFDMVRATWVRDFEPGEIVRFVPGAPPEALDPLPPRPHARCIFELVYFSRADSVVDGLDVQGVRLRLGARLWQEQPAEADVVICVPDSSMPAAIGYARAAGLPFDTGLMRNHYIGRTFIEPYKGLRDFSARIKYNPVRSVVEDQRVVVVDDSIVRGTTMRRIVGMLRAAGAREVHLRIASPPWRNPCLYGIDVPDPSEFVATGREVEDIRTHIGADSLGYLSPEGMKSAADPGKGWCLACFTGEYPTERVKLEKDIFEREGVSVLARTGAETAARGAGL
jgi:amidophosphoribosyltransferase